MTEQTHIEGSFLRASSVGTATLENYQRHWQEFTTWCKKKKLSIIKEAELDRALVQYLDVVYAAGEGLGIGNYVKASVLFHRPELKGRLGLPKTQQALKGWRRLNPPKSRMPIPFEVVALMAVEAKKNNKVEIGLVLLLSYMLYLRQGEFAKIRVCDVVRPVPRGGPLYQHWGIVLHPQEEGIPSKTAQWDEALPRFALSEFPGKSNRCGYEIEEQATNRNGVQGDSTGGQPIHATTVAFRDSQCAAPVSPTTRRSILRTGGQTQAHHRSADQRKMGNRSVSQKLRKGVEAQPAVRQSAGSKATRMHPGNRAIGSSFPRPALQVQRPIKTSVFLEIFSGSGRLGQSVFRSHHWPVLLWDIDFGEDYDLTRLQNQRKILEWMRCGYVRSGHLGTPCNSFSRARDQPGGPPPLRSDDRPLGLANLKIHDALKVKVGNQLMRFTARVLRIALELIIPFTLENPARSRLWICPPILAIRRRRHVVHQQVEYCSFGEAWRKSTLFLGIHIDLCPLEPHRCIGSKRGLCKFSGKPHIPLAGRDSSGQWRTKTAEPYPRGLCKVLAVCFGNAEVRRIADSFSRFLQPTEIPVG